MKHIQTAATGMAALIAATVITVTPTAIAHATLPKREYRTSITPTAKITECSYEPATDNYPARGTVGVQVTDPDNVGYHLVSYYGDLVSDWGAYVGSAPFTFYPDVLEKGACNFKLVPNANKQVPVIPDADWNQMIENQKVLDEWYASQQKNSSTTKSTAKATAKATTKSTAKASAKATTKSTAKASAKASVSAAPSVPVSSVSPSVVVSASAPVTSPVSSASVSPSMSSTSGSVDVADAPAVTSPVRSASAGVNGWLVAAGVVVIVAAAGAGVWWRRIVKKTR